jgi:hypothetical protein
MNSSIICAIITIIALVSIILSIIALKKVSSKSAKKSGAKSDETFAFNAEQEDMCAKNKDNPIYNAKCCIADMTTDEQQRTAAQIVQYAKQFGLQFDEDQFIQAFMQMDCSQDFNLESIFQSMQSDKQY